MSKEKQVEDESEDVGSRDARDDAILNRAALSSQRDIRKILSEEGDVQACEVVPATPDGDCGFTSIARVLEVISQSELANKISRSKFISEVNRIYTDADIVTKGLIQKMFSIDRVEEGETQLEKWSSKFKSSGYWLQTEHFKVISRLYSLEIEFYYLPSSEDGEVIFSRHDGYPVINEWGSEDLPKVKLAYVSTILKDDSVNHFNHYDGLIVEPTQEQKEQIERFREIEEESLSSEFEEQVKHESIEHKSDAESGSADIVSEKISALYETLGIEPDFELTGPESDLAEYHKMSNEELYNAALVDISDFLADEKIVLIMRFRDNDAEATFYIAELLSNNIYFLNDLLRFDGLANLKMSALGFYEHAAELGHIKSQVKSGVKRLQISYQTIEDSVYDEYYGESTGIIKKYENYEAAFDWFSLAAEAGDREAKFYLAGFYEKNLQMNTAFMGDMQWVIDRVDWDKALELYGQAVAQGYSKADRNFAKLKNQIEQKKAKDEKKSKLEKQVDQVLDISPDLKIRKVVFRENRQEIALPQVFAGAQDWSEIPEFAVITGANGLGKSHLLSYITNAAFKTFGGGQVLYIHPNFYLNDNANSHSSRDTSYSFRTKKEEWLPIIKDYYRSMHELTYNSYRFPVSVILYLEDQGNRGHIQHDAVRSIILEQVAGIEKKDEAVLEILECVRKEKSHIKPVFQEIIYSLNLKIQNSSEDIDENTVRSEIKSVISDIMRAEHEWLPKVVEHFRAGSSSGQHSSGSHFAMKVIRSLEQKIQKGKLLLSGVTQKIIEEEAARTIDYEINKDQLRLSDPAHALDYVFQTYITRVDSIRDSIHGIDGALYAEGALKLHGYYKKLSPGERKELGFPEDPVYLELQEFLECIISNEGIKQHLIDDFAYEASGKKPWEVMNEILGRYRFKYKIQYNKGDVHNRDRYKVSFTRGEEKDIVLSSGERMMLSLLSWLYYTYGLSSSGDKSEKKLENKVKIMLLDEPDKHLDPKLCRTFINVVKKEFVENGIQVFIATHRIDTISLVPEGSVYSIERESATESKIVPITNIHATLRLTRNVRELSRLKFQVYTESHDDMLFYQAMHRILLEYSNEVRHNNFLEDEFLPSRHWKELRQEGSDGLFNRLLSRRYQPSFSSTAKDEKGGGGGKGAAGETLVRDVIMREKRKAVSKELLIDPTLESPFAIIDSDYGESKSKTLKDPILKDRMIVLERHSVENYIFDPWVFFSVMSEEAVEAFIKDTEFKKICLEGIDYVSGIREGKIDQKESSSVILKYFDFMIRMVLDKLQNLEKSFTTTIRICELLAPKEWNEEELFNAMTSSLDAVPAYVFKAYKDMFQIRDIESYKKYDSKVANGKINYLEFIRDVYRSRTSHSEEVSVQQIIEIFLTQKREIPIIYSSSKHPVISRYPEVFLRLRGHDFEKMMVDFITKKSQVEDRGIKEFLIDGICSIGEIFIPQDLASMFFALNHKIRIQANKIVKPHNIELTESASEESGSSSEQAEEVVMLAYLHDVIYDNALLNTDLGKNLLSYSAMNYGKACTDLLLELGTNAFAAKEITNAALKQGPKSILDTLMGIEGSEVSVNELAIIASSSLFKTESAEASRSIFDLLNNIRNFGKKGFLFSEELSEIQFILNRYDIPIRVTDQSSLDKAYKLLSLKIHPDRQSKFSYDKEVATEDFVKFNKHKVSIGDNEVCKSKELGFLTNTQQLINEVSIGIKVADVSIDTMRLINDPDTNKGTKLVSDLMQLYNLNYGFDKYSIGVRLGEIIYKGYDKDDGYTEALSLAGSTISFAVIPKVISYINPWAGLAYSACITGYSAYLMYDNANAFYEELTSQSSQPFSLALQNQVMGMSEDSSDTVL